MSCGAACRQQPSWSLPPAQLSPPGPPTPTAGTAHPSGRGSARTPGSQTSPPSAGNWEKRMRVAGEHPYSHLHPCPAPAPRDERVLRRGSTSLARGLCPLPAPVAGLGRRCEVPSPARRCAGEGGQCQPTLPAPVPLPHLPARPRAHKLLTSFSPASSSCRSDIWRLPGKRGFCVGKHESGKGFGGSPASATALGAPGLPVRPAASVPGTGTALQRRPGSDAGGKGANARSAEPWVTTAAPTHGARVLSSQKSRFSLGLGTRGAGRRWGHQLAHGIAESWRGRSQYLLRWAKPRHAAPAFWGRSHHSSKPSGRRAQPGSTKHLFPAELRKEGTATGTKAAAAACRGDEGARRHPPQLPTLLLAACRYLNATDFFCSIPPCRICPDKELCQGERGFPRHGRALRPCYEDAPRHPRQLARRGADLERGHPLPKQGPAQQAGNKLLMMREKTHPGWSPGILPGPIPQPR